MVSFHTLDLHVATLNLLVRLFIAAINSSSLSKSDSDQVQIFTRRGTVGLCTMFLGPTHEWYTSLMKEQAGE